MPIFGVMKLTFERDGGSMRGEDDFFSVARTMPFVAKRKVNIWTRSIFKVKPERTFNTQCRDTLIDSIQGIF
jgi:hypothetical protein